MDQVSTVNIALRVGAVTDTVTATAGVDLVDTRNSTVGQLITAETIDRVPMLTRNVFELIQLSAGVTPVNGSANSSQSQVVQNISNGFPNLDVSAYTINGSVQGSVYYMFDSSPLARPMEPLSCPDFIFPRMPLASSAWRRRTLPPSIRAVAQASSAWSANPAATSSMATALW